MITVLCTIFSLLCPPQPLTGTQTHSLTVAAHSSTVHVTANPKKSVATFHQKHRTKHHVATTSRKSSAHAGATKSHAPISTTNREQLFQQFRAWCYLHAGECYAPGRY